jgi:hypothetical protein
MAGDLIKHVIEEWNPGSEPALSGSVKIQTNRNPGFEGISGNFSLPHGGTIAKWQKRLSVD